MNHEELEAHGHKCACENSKLANHCKSFIKDQKVRCPEDVWQSDKVIENAYEFIEGICNIVGYFKDDED